VLHRTTQRKDPLLQGEAIVIKTPWIKKKETTNRKAVFVTLQGEHKGAQRQASEARTFTVYPQLSRRGKRKGEPTAGKKQGLMRCRSRRPPGRMSRGGGGTLMSKKIRSASPLFSSRYPFLDEQLTGNQGDYRASILSANCPRYYLPFEPLISTPPFESSCRNCRLTG